jgi:GNAT superfamily N-acetyltransferase
LDWTFHLLESQLRHHYEKALDFGGWDVEAKRKELKDPLGRYFFLLHKDSKLPLGVLYFQFVKEDSYDSDSDTESECAAFYVLELLVEPASQGQGLGRWLINLAFQLAQTFEMDKVMLTCFKSNSKALKFYDKMG